MREIRGAIERIDVPAIFAAGVAEAAFFAKHVVLRPVFPNALSNQRLRFAVRRRDQIGLALVFDLDILIEIFHQQRASFARNHNHPR